MRTERTSIDDLIVQPRLELRWLVGLKIWISVAKFPLFSSQKARFEKGKELLEAEFRSLLTRHSKAVPPILILDAISVDEELEVQEEVVLEHLPEAVLRDVVCIAGWLVENGRNQGAAPQNP